jgi:hypothetical protein
MAETPDSLLLQEGARPNDGNYPIAFLGQGEETNGAASDAPAPETRREEKPIEQKAANGNGDHGASSVPPLKRTDYQYDPASRYATHRTSTAQQSRPAVFSYR